MDDVVFAILQVVLGLVVVWCIYQMSLWIIREDRLVMGKRKAKPQMRAETKIVDGYADSILATNRMWNTINPEGTNYIRLQPSWNLKGGAQFSYSYWINVGDPSAENVAEKDIILRGDTKKYAYTRVTETPDAGYRAPGIRSVESVNDVLTKCPRIRFGPTFDTVVVEFNTLHNPDEKIIISPNEATNGQDPTMRHNLIKLSQRKWTLFTFTFEDNVAISDFEDGILVRVYVNDVLYHTARVHSTLRQNNGSFYLFPTRPTGSVASPGEIQQPLKTVRIGDIIHYSYALGPEAVRDLFRQGPPGYVTKDILGDDNTFGDPLYLSEYNRLDIYNT